MFFSNFNWNIHWIDILRYFRIKNYLYAFPYFPTQSWIVDNAKAFNLFLASFGGGRALLGSVSRVSINISCKESTIRHRNLWDLSNISMMTWNADNLISEWSFSSCFIKVSCNGWRRDSSDLNVKIRPMKNLQKVS